MLPVFFYPSVLESCFQVVHLPILQAIRDAPSRHMDSTSWRIDGNPYNLWTFLTKTEAIFVVRKSNGHEVPMEMLAEHKGTDIHDRHSAFETMASNTNNDQQYC